MAQYHIPDPEDLIECPYDKVHMVRAKRMQYHLMKCRKNYTGRDFATCPFNARHEMPKPELRYHMVNCPDKAMIEASLSYEKAKKNGEGTMFKGCTDVPVYDNYVPPCEENWDEEIPAVPRIGVDPSFFARIDQRVLTTGLSKAKKKEYNRQMFLPPEERRFVSELNYTDKNSEGEVEEEKLRLPKSAPKTFVSSNQQNIQQPSTVFAYSLSMAGVGRGHNGMNGINPCAVINGGPESVNHSAMNGVNPSLGMLGRGRGLCRGSAPPGFYPNSTGRGLGVQPPAPSIAPSDPLENIPGVPLDSNSVFSMGVGRGRGNRTQASGDNPQFVVPNASFITEVSKQNGNNNHDLREEKKLRKKLRQIELLEKKAEEGYKLTEEEEIKVAMKKELQESLKAMQMGDN